MTHSSYHTPPGSDYTHSYIHSLVDDNDQHDDGFCCRDNDNCSKICSILCFSISWCTLIFCSFTVITILQDLSTYLIIVYIICVGCAMISLWRTSTEDPGYQEVGLGEAEWIESSAELAESTFRMFEEQRRQILDGGSLGMRNENTHGNDNGYAEQHVQPSVMSDKDIQWQVKLAVQRYRRKLRYCEFCKNFKVNNAHHCRICQRCISRMDHHCPWVYNCVGRDNLRWFLLFLFYTFISSIMSLGFFLYRSYVVLMIIRPISLPLSGIELFMCLISMILCTFFGIFVVIISFEQYEAISTGIAGIDALQGIGEDEQLTLIQGLRKYTFDGKPMSWKWFIPIRFANENDKRS